LKTFRFAPTPNGYLHRGHALSALLNARAADAAGGCFLLRIEDYDTTRASPTYEAAIFDDLAWLGLSWAEPALRQRERLDVYRSVLDSLRKLGLVYPAFLSRSEIAARVADADAGGRPWPRDPDGAPLYPGPERNWAEAALQKEMDRGRPIRPAPPHEPRQWRASADVVHGANTGLADPRRGHEGRQPEPRTSWGDVILARKEVPASYHLSVVVDDAFQGVTDVVRGLDLRPCHRRPSPACKPCSGCPNRPTSTTA
jgi:glutamyl-Q tRNA(Asp) synthetase